MTAKGILASAWRLFLFIRQWLPKELRDEALQMILSARTLSHLTDNHARREWVVSGLLKRGWKENQARAAVEIALAAWKKLNPSA